jgi:tRNA modification GTPase
MTTHTQPIAAIATPFGQGAISMVRLSGEGCLELLDRVFQPRAGGPLAATPAGKRRLGWIVGPATGGRIDEVVVTPLRAPGSFTGEDMAEICGHGGVHVTNRVLEALLAAGARAAEPGEFSKRAFLNGKLDLTQAEAVMDVIQARTDLALRVAAEQLDGRLGREALDLRAALLAVLAHLEAYIDFPEEGIEPDTGAAFVGRVEAVLAQVDALLATAEQGRMLREGVRVVLCGKPNAGKSSLLNALLGYERAIVNAAPGTTRDSLEESLSLRGIPLVLTDTAGLREQTSDEVERAGMERTRRLLERADLVLLLADSSQPPDRPFLDLHRSDTHGHTLLVLTKADLPRDPAWADVPAPDAEVSAATGAGLEDLHGRMHVAITQGVGDLAETRLAINARHRACLALAREALVAGLEGLRGGYSPEFVAVDLRAAMHHIGDVAGHADTEELLGEIFGTFCIGK